MRTTYSHFHSYFQFLTIIQYPRVKVCLDHHSLELTDDCKAHLKKMIAAENTQKTIARKNKAEVKSGSERNGKAKELAAGDIQEFLDLYGIRLTFISFPG